MKVILSLIFLVCVGCQDFSSRQVESTGEVQSVQSQIQFSPDGVGAIFVASTLEGFIVDAPVLQDEVDALPIQLGPLSEKFSISRQETSTSPGVISIAFDLNRFSFPMAVRGENMGQQICRYKLEGDSVEIRAEVEVRNEGGVPRLSILNFSPPIVSEFSISLIGACALEFEESSLEPLAKSYLTTALQDAAAAVFENSPTQLLGLSTGARELAKGSGGSLIVEQLLTPSGALIEPDKVSIKLDSGIRSTRDRCVPPLQYSPQSEQTSKGDDELREDISFSFSKNYLKDLFASSVLAGLFCWDGSPVPLNETKLEEIGLADLPLSSSLSVRFQPASLPKLSFENSGLVRVEWPLFTVDTHAEIFGAFQRVVLISGSLDLRLRPRVGEGGISFDIESMNLATSEVKSKWSNQIFTSVDLDKWTQRLILLSFEDRFNLPSPLQPSIDLGLVGLKSTDADMILLYSVD